MSYRRPAFEALAYVCPTTRPAGECMGGRLAMSLAGSQPTPSEAAGPIAATAVLDQRPFQKANTLAQKPHLNVCFTRSGCAASIACSLVSAKRK
jgi:hypothetical protein